MKVRHYWAKTIKLAQWSFSEQLVINSAIASILVAITIFCAVNKLGILAIFLGATAFAYVFVVVTDLYELIASRMDARHKKDKDSV